MSTKFKKIALSLGGIALVFYIGVNLALAMFVFPFIYKVYNIIFSIFNM